MVRTAAAGVSLKAGRAMAARVEVAKADRAAVAPRARVAAREKSRADIVRVVGMCSGEKRMEWESGAYYIGLGTATVGFFANAKFCHLGRSQTLFWAIGQSEPENPG